MNFEIGDLVRCTSFPDTWQITEIDGKHIYAQSLHSDKRADFRATSIWSVYTFFDLCHASDDIVERMPYGQRDPYFAQVWNAAGQEIFEAWCITDGIAPFPEEFAYLYDYVTER